MSINTVTLLGRAGKDPEVREVGQNNSKVATFSLCTGGKYKTKDGREVDDTAWHSIVAWHGLATLTEKYIKKGSQLLVVGHITYRKWTDNNNVERQTTEIVADKVELCGGASTGQQSAEQKQAQPTYQNNYGSTPMPYPTEDGPTDDLPF